jgi:predicted ribonuclease YlaK
MARKKPSAGIGTNPVPFGMSNKQMKRKKPINLDYIKKIEPLTDNQRVFFDSYKEDKNLVAYGCAGTGKTFITLYNALMDVLDPKSPYEKIYIVRSLVATREIGFLPGDHDDKSYLYQIPYKHMVKYMFQMPDDRAIIIVDEFQNLNFHELDSMITRIGQDSKIMFCGDATQTDLVKQNERNGIVDFLRILRNMPSFDIIEFGADDICRSGLVKEYIISKLELGIEL